MFDFLAEGFLVPPVMPWQTGVQVWQAWRAFGIAIIADCELGPEPVARADCGYLIPHDLGFTWTGRLALIRGQAICVLGRLEAVDLFDDFLGFLFADEASSGDVVELELRYLPFPLFSSHFSHPRHRPSEVTLSVSDCRTQVLAARGASERPPSPGVAGSYRRTERIAMLSLERRCVSYALTTFALSVMSTTAATATIGSKRWDQTRATIAVPLSMMLMPSTARVTCLCVRPAWTASWYACVR